MKRCTKCVLPENYPGITFNQEGVCNYCLTHKKWRYKGEEQLRRLLKSSRDKSKKGGYDCVVAISGGRDSSFMLNYLVRECNLRVLAYTADHGYIPETAKANIRRMTDILEIDLVVDEHDYLKRCIKTNISSWLRRPSPSMVPMICCGCKLGAFRGMLETAKQYDAPLIFLGAKTPIETGNLKKAFFATNRLGRSVGRDHILSLSFGLLHEVMRNPYYLNPVSAGVYVSEYIHYFHFERVQRMFYPDHNIVEFYTYIAWDEDRILSTIKEELDWRKDAGSASSWRFDCRLSFLKNHLLRETIGITEKDDCLSTMIREGMISREKALERVEVENKIPQDYISDLIDDVGLSEMSARRLHRILD